MVPVQVYGVKMVVKILGEPPTGLSLYCPQGSAIRYGQVVARGDGFDEGANAFREMPELGTVVAFEEAQEGVEGHYFYAEGSEYRVLHLDAVIISYPQE